MSKCLFIEEQAECEEIKNEAERIESLRSSFVDDLSKAGERGT